MSPINTAEAPRVSVTPTTLGELDLYLKSKKALLEPTQYDEFAKSIGDQGLAHTARLNAFTGDQTDSLIVERVTGTSGFIKEMMKQIDGKVKVTETTKAAAVAKNKVDSAGAGTPKLKEAEKVAENQTVQAKAVVTKETKVAQQNERRTIEGQNTTVEQAKSFVAFLESYPDLKDSNFVKQLKGEVFIQGSESSPSESYGTSRNGSKEAIYSSSVKMNIPSLIAHAVKGTPYVNFSSGFGGYQDNFIAVTKEAYKDPKIKAALDAFYTITQSGATGETALRASEAIKTAPKTRAELTTLLVSLTAGDDTLSDGKGAIFNLTGTQLKKFLSDTKESEFIPTLSKALLVSRSTYSISTLEKLGQDIQTNPSLAFAILGGLNTMDRNGGITSFDTTSALKEAEALKKIGDKLKKALDEARNTLPANLTESQKKAALEALDLMKKEANLPDAQKAFGLFFTNQGAAAGANISKLISPDTSLSAGVTVAGGKLAVEFAMRSMVSNTISGGTSIGAGVGATIGGPAVLPFAEIWHTNHQASGNLRVFPMGGFAITLASELSNVNKVVRQASEMVRDKNSLALKLNEFRVAGVKADTIKFTPDISSVASDEKAGVESLVNETNERTQGLLKARGFDTITDETARYIMLEQAIKDATQETTLAITRNMLSAGPRWKSIGLTFGKIWSFPFIIPFGSRGNDEMNVTRIPGQKTEGKKTEEKGLSIDAYLSDKKVTDTKDAKGNITSRTFHFDPKKFIVSGDTTRDGGTVQNGSTPHWMIFNPTKNTIELTGQPKALNFETNASGKTILIIGERTEFGKQEITTGTKPMDSAVLLDTSMTRGELAEKLKRNAELRSNIFNLARTKHPEIVTMFELLANNNIDWLKTHLASMKQYKTIGKQLLDLGLADNTIASFKYGSQASNNKPASFYTNENVATMRKRSLKAERDLAVKNGISAMNGNGHSDVAFVLGKNEKNHTPTMSGSWYPGQSMTVSVFSTPTNGVGTIDKYDGSVQLIGKKIDITDATYRAQIIDDTSRSKTALTTPLKALNDFLTSQKITKVIEMSAYCDMLKTGDASKLGIAGLTFTAGKLPAVFESRAMIRDQGGNICINRSHGVVYPLFTIGTTSQTDAPPLADIAVTATSISEGIITPGSSTVSVGPTENSVLVGVGGIHESKPTPTAPAVTPGPTSPGTTAPGWVPTTPGAPNVAPPTPPINPSPTNPSRPIPPSRP